MGIFDHNLIVVKFVFALQKSASDADITVFNFNLSE